MLKSKTITSSKTMNEALEDSINHINHGFNANSPLAIQMGFDDLDYITTGLNKGSLVVIGGRTAMGKTALLTNIINNIASNRHSVAMFSLDDSCTRLTLKIMSYIGGIDITKLSSGKLDIEDWPRLNHAINKLQNLPIHIDQTQNLSIEDIRLRSIAINEDIKQNKFNNLDCIDSEGLELIIIDYLQLISNFSDDSKKSIAYQLKALAIELNIPVFVTSQVNRSIEGRKNKRPKMSDIYADENIEHYADQIIFIYRDDLYNTNSENKGITELIITKNSYGPLGTVKLCFEQKYQRFSNPHNCIKSTNLNQRF